MIAFQLSEKVRVVMMIVATNTFIERNNRMKQLTEEHIEENQRTRMISECDLKAPIATVERAVK